MTRALFLLALASLAGCRGSRAPQAPPSDREPASLSGAFAGDFLVGVALNRAQVTGGDPLAASLVPAQFNAATPENVMKWETVHPEPGVYDWTGADAFVDYAEANGLAVVGHPLVWHSQTPAWVFRAADGSPLSREAGLARMREHIEAVVGRYRGRVLGWDVVNEALNEDGTLRDSPWRRIIGDDYAAHAFRFAHAADPDAELYYNDYSLESPPKRAGAIRLVRSIREAGARVTGVGTQGHWTLDWPTPSGLDSTIRELGALGPVMVSELDIDVLPARGANRSADVGVREEGADALDPYPGALPHSAQAQLASRYADLFRVLVARAETVSRVTFWGVTDGDSWKNDWPIRGRTNHPLLFDREGRPKAAFWAVLREARR